MNIVSIGIAVASVVTGLAGAGVAYQLATVESPGSSAAAPADASAGKKADQRVRWKPCEAPAVREGRACVTDEVRVIQVGGATSVGNAVVTRRASSRLGHHAFDDHGGDRDDDFDDDAFDDDSSGHGGDDDFDDVWDDDRDDDHDDDRDDGDRDDRDDDDSHDDDDERDD